MFDILTNLRTLIRNINLKYINLASRIFGLFLLALGIEMLVAAINAMIL